MPYQCVLHDQPPKHEDRKIGDMWFTERNPRYCSIEYLETHASSRLPLVVVLPSGFPFCVDSPQTTTMNEAPINRHGWTVTGTAPNITVIPSINEEGYYHGWLKDGVLSDDLEGRPQGGTVRE